MYLSIIFLPLLNSLLIQLLGFKLQINNVFKIVLTNMLLTLFFSYYSVYEVVLCESPCYLKLTDWIVASGIQISWGFQFDALTTFMFVVVNTISTCVHLYSIEYMSEDPHLKRFLSYLSLFTFFMLILVSADNLLQMFVGWEGVGLCSFLLINFWFQRLQANKAALKAMIINRIGDFGLALGIFIFFYVFRSLNYSVISTLAAEHSEVYFIFFNYEINALTLACLFIFIGCMGKSAQVGLHTWLPDAMEGPTPVSALIHAATMVTAGVFLISRLSYVFELTSHVTFLITILGAITAFLAGTTGLAQNDLKRVIAYSTCSQLGYMFFVSGISNYHVSFFHLSNHAFFKALLFLGAGSVIHALSDEQDMRKMGGLADSLVFTCVCMAIGSAALEGFPFSTGFYSKDTILELTNVFYTSESFFANWLGTISVATTAFYSTRSFFYTFIEDPLSPKKYLMNTHESSFPMALPLFILSCGGLVIGLLSKDLIIGLGNYTWNGSLLFKAKQWVFFEAEYLEHWIKDIPLLFGFLGGFAASYLYSEDVFSTFWFKWKITNFGRSLYNFFNRKWFFDKVYNEWISQNVLNFAYKHSYQNIDRGILEFVGPNGISNFMYKKTLQVNQLSINFLNHYVYTIILSFIAFLFFFYYLSYVLIWYNLTFILLLISSLIFTFFNLKK